MEGVPRATHSPGSGGREASGGCRLSAGPAGRSNPANRAARRLWDPLADEAARDGVFKIYLCRGLREWPTYPQNNK